MRLFVWQAVKFARDMMSDEYQATYDTLLFAASICLKERIKFTVLSIPETEEYQEYSLLKLTHITAPCGCRYGIGSVNLMASFRYQICGSFHITHCR